MLGAPLLPLAPRGPAGRAARRLRFRCARLASLPTAASCPNSVPVAQPSRHTLRPLTHTHFCPAPDLTSLGASLSLSDPLRLALSRLGIESKSLPWTGVFPIIPC